MKLDTPCIGICSTVYGDEICRGCKRVFTEVIDWNHYDDTKKDFIFNRLATQIVIVMKDKIEITNKQLLIEQLIQHNIRYRQEQDPLCWAYHLLRVMNHKVETLMQAGFVIKLNYQHFTLRQLFTLIDMELLKLSQEYYQKLVSL